MNDNFLKNNNKSHTRLNELLRGKLVKKGKKKKDNDTWRGHREVSRAS